MVWPKTHTCTVQHSWVQYMYSWTPLKRMSRDQNFLSIIGGFQLLPTRQIKRNKSAFHNYYKQFALLLCPLQRGVTVRKKYAILNSLNLISSCFLLKKRGQVAYSKQILHRYIVKFPSVQTNATILFIHLF